MHADSDANILDHEPLQSGLFFSVFSTSQGKAKASREAPRLNTHHNQCIIINHCTFARPAHVARSWPLARLQVLQNSGSQMFMLRF